jgi:hypothetical protein
MRAVELVVGCPAAPQGRFGFAESKNHSDFGAGGLVKQTVCQANRAQALSLVGWLARMALWIGEPEGQRVRGGPGRSVQALH